MATPAHCYYSFECLSASFKDQDCPSLAVVEELWEQHEQTKQLAALQEHQWASQNTPSRDNPQDMDEFSCDDEGETLEGGDIFEDSEDGDNQATAKEGKPRTIKLPSIKRLQGDLSSSSSSTSTTPSMLSANSSRSALSTSTTVTSPISQPSRSSEGQITARPKHLEEPSYPLFVTWNTVSKNGQKSLRGCIGTFEAQELAQGLKSYALTSYVLGLSQAVFLISYDWYAEHMDGLLTSCSAFDDTRFSPIPASLVPSLSCSLTLLGNFEPCEDAMDWVLGTHGLRIAFVHRGRRYGATYLPDVAVEQGWTKEETVESLMRKAGWSGGGVARRFLRGSTNTGVSGSGKPWDDVYDFRATRYQGLKASASYAEWQAWREWVKGLDDGRAQLLDPAS
jgi:AMME syndrome candidate gene 1 protein